MLPGAAESRAWTACQAFPAVEGKVRSGTPLNPSSLPSNSTAVKPTALVSHLVHVHVAGVVD